MPDDDRGLLEFAEVVLWSGSRRRRGGVGHGHRGLGGVAKEGRIVMAVVWAGCVELE